MSINPKDIQLTYCGVPIRLDSIENARITAFAENALTRREGVLNAPTVVKKDAYFASQEQGCLDFNPGTNQALDQLKDPEHPILKMSNLQQVIDAEVGGGKPIHAPPYTPTCITVRAKRVERNYTTDDGWNISIGDYMVLTKAPNGETVWVPMAKSFFETEFKPYDPNENAPNSGNSEQVAQLNAENNGLRERCARLYNIIAEVRHQNDKHHQWFLERAVEFVNLAEQLDHGSEYLDKNVL